MDASTLDLHRVLRQTVSALLPDPVCIDTIHAARDGSCTLCNHRKRNIKVVIGVAAPHQTEVITQLTDTYRTLHGPEVRICEWDIDGLQLDAVTHLAPVGIDHVGGGKHTGLLTKLRHHLTAGETVLCTTRILDVCKDLLKLRCHLERLLEGPAAVRIEVDTCIRECLLDGRHGLILHFRLEHAALQLEILEAVLLRRCLRQCDDVLRVHRFFVTKSVPLAVRVGLIHVWKGGLLTITDIEKVGKETYGCSLKAIAHEGSRRNLEELAHQVKKRCFDCGDNMYAGTKIEGLKSSNIILDVCIEPCTYTV